MPVYRTCPRWPNSHEFAGGLLKHDSLWEYQTFLTVKTATAATSPVLNMYISEQRHVQLRTGERTLCRRAIAEREINIQKSSDPAMWLRKLLQPSILIRQGEKQITDSFQKEAVSLSNISQGWHCLGSWYQIYMESKTFPSSVVFIFREA